MKLNTLILILGVEQQPYKMAVYKLFPTKDATIYSRYPTMNTGLDSILEANADFSTTTPHVSRYLIQFDQNEIDSLFNNKIDR